MFFDAHGSYQNEILASTAPCLTWLMLVQHRLRACMTATCQAIMQLLVRWSAVCTRWEWDVLQILVALFIGSQHDQVRRATKCRGPIWSESDPRWLMRIAVGCELQMGLPNSTSGGEREPNRCHTESYGAIRYPCSYVEWRLKQWPASASKVSGGWTVTSR